MSISDELLKNIIVKYKALDRRALRRAQKEAERQSRTLYEYVTYEHLLDREVLGRTIAQEYEIQYVDLDRAEIDSNAVKLLGHDMTKEHGVLAFLEDEKGMHVAIANPADKEVMKQVQEKLEDKKVIFYFADLDSIERSLDHSYRVGSKEFLSLIQQLPSKGSGITEAHKVPIIRIVNRLLEYAYVNNASDVHIEPYEDETYIRFRIDGILHDIAKIPPAIHDLIITRIKILARLRTDEHRAAQDGKLKFAAQTERVDARVSIVPVVYGEKVVMRLLSEQSSQLDLEQLGLRTEDFNKIIHSMNQPWGMILATGPTGSGKTTTLYSIIKKLNTREVNISTIEDPVEYDIKGVNQIQVNRKTELTFAKGLRSIVRQDPDIIMVGEIRDEETARIAINSAMTGHLVLSTLHTNDAATTLPRLFDMGVQPFLVASTINIAIAQRLVRRVCGKCTYQKPIDDKICKVIADEFSPEIIKKYNLDLKTTVLSEGRGCAECQNTGYKGRIGIYEVLDMDDEMKALVMQQANAETIKQKAIEHGMLTMIEDGMTKVLTGETTLSELLRVSKE